MVNSRNIDVIVNNYIIKLWFENINKNLICLGFRRSFCKFKVVEIEVKICFGREFNVS